MSEFDKMVGERTKYAREQQGLNQQGLANVLGKSRQAANQYEKGDRSLSPELLKKIALYLGVSTDFLLGGAADAGDLFLTEEIALAFNEFKKLSPRDRIVVVEVIRALGRISVPL